MIDEPGAGDILNCDTDGLEAAQPGCWCMGRDSEGLRMLAHCNSRAAPANIQASAGRAPRQGSAITLALSIGSGRAVVLPDMAIRVYRRRGADAGDVVHLGGGIKETGN